MRVLVTGTSGFIGHHCIQQLSERGHEPICLARPQTERSKLPSETEVRESSYDDPEGLKKACAGVDAVLHCAGIVRATSLDKYWKANVAATRNLCEAAVSSGVERFVFISSLAAGGRSKRGEPRNETHPDEPLTWYGLSKFAAELAVRGLFRNYTILRPCAVYGPREKDIYRALKTLKQRGLDLRPGRTQPQLSLVHGEDVALAASVCLECGDSAAKTYYLSDGESREWDDFISYAARELGVEYKTRRMPEWVADLYAFAGYFIGRFTGKPVLVSPEKLFEMKQEACGSSVKKLENDTGFRPRYDLAKGIRDTVKWYTENGWL
ncbi:MAG: NAD(P)-dependent oxidoreductase [Planctomycetota bacterium]|nr:NAD(P)-dependent oxidoreductase [Planctomycetota bacterium]